MSFEPSDVYMLPMHAIDMHASCNVGERHTLWWQFVVPML